MIFDETGDVEQAYLKVGLYSGPGGGKTFTALSVCTALGKTMIVDTERGSEPYRKTFFNPDGTPFIVARTRSAEQVYKEVIPGALERDCKCLIVDQVSTIWDDRKDAYILREFRRRSKNWDFIERNGKLPFQAWSFIKRPYRKMIRALLDCPMHVFILSRLSVEFSVTPKGEPVKTGETMEAEKNTPYEPAILVKMERNPQNKREWLALVEKDRWRTLEGEVFTNPDVSMFKPILAKLGNVQGVLPEPEVSDEESVEEEPKANSGQLKLLRILAKKGGIKDADVERELPKLDSSRAAQLINAMTLGDYSHFKS